MSSELRDQLHEIIRTKALQALDEPVRLSAGGWSSHFIDGKKGLAAWKDLEVACRALAEAVDKEGIEFDAVGGLTLGADALAVGTAAVTGTSWFVVRKETKEHGTGRMIEGAPLGPGTRAFVVDDVVTTGGSILKAVDRVEDSGATIVAAATLVDRSGMANAQLDARGIPYFPMATYQDLGIAAVTSGAQGSSSD